MMAELTPTIVVGVDGSAPSIEALRWAVAQAQLTGSTLRAVTVWTFPDEPTPFGIVPELPPEPDQLAPALAELEAVVAEAAAATPGLQVTAQVLRGRAAPVLVGASEGAALLVVGSRGRGGLAETLLGSVSEYCVRHARCPVVVLRGPAPRS
jgi:nucleotide-binding universal stress UspA family protein